MGCGESKHAVATTENTICKCKSKIPERNNSVASSSTDDVNTTTKGESSTSTVVANDPPSNKITAAGETGKAESIKNDGGERIPKNDIKEDKVKEKAEEIQNGDAKVGEAIEGGEVPENNIKEEKVNEKVEETDNAGAAITKVEEKQDGNLKEDSENVKQKVDDVKEDEVAAADSPDATAEKEDQLTVVPVDEAKASAVVVEEEKENVSATSPNVEQAE